MKAKQTLIIMALAWAPADAAWAQSAAPLLPPGAPGAIELAAAQVNEFDGKWEGTFVGNQSCGDLNIPIQATIKKGNVSALINKNDYQQKMNGQVSKDGELSLSGPLSYQSEGGVKDKKFHMMGLFSGDAFQGSFNVGNNQWGECSGVIRMSRLGAGQARPGTPSMTRDLAIWQGIQNSTRATDFEGYVAAFPKGLFADLARARMKALRAEEATRLANRRQMRLIKKARRERNLATLTKPGQDALSGIDFGNYHALIIGIDDYRNLPNLTSAVNDARAMAEVLKEQYGFKVTLLIDPTRGDIIDAFDDFRAVLGFKDNLLIYYAGHGWLDEDSDEGYWLPVDAKPDRRTNWVSNATLTSTLKALAAKHVMVLADSCYSGRLVRAANVNLEGVGAPEYFRKMSQKIARVVMTSGGLEPVVDSDGGAHSPFARALLKALGDNQSILDGSGLFNAVRRPVMVAADQTPQYSNVRQAGHDGGDFLFVRRR